MNARLHTVLAVLALLALPATAQADLTAFFGVNGQPSNRTVVGLSGGFGLAIIGFEVEYSRTREDEMADAPSLTTGVVNLLLQTPFAVRGVQAYGTIGAGAYREQLGEKHRETHLATNVGAGVKVRLAGPVRLRLDYRVFLLRGSPLTAKPQRFYAGINLGF
jgi:hypothetical protein